MSMFQDAVHRDIQSTSQRLASKLTSWRESADRWFDGSVDSVDRRLEKCRGIIATVDAAIGRLPTGDTGPFIAAAAELSADQRSLTGLREDLLTGASGREAGVVLPVFKVASDGDEGLSFSDEHAILPQIEHGLNMDNWVGQGQHEAKRWIELESRKFMADNADAAHNMGEITARARRYAELKTSAMPPAASESITAAFTGRVAYLSYNLADASDHAERKVAAVVDFPDEMIFS